MPARGHERFPAFKRADGRIYIPLTDVSYDTALANGVLLRFQEPKLAQKPGIFG